MKSKLILVSLVAILTFAMLGSFASAISSLDLSNQYVEIDRLPATGNVAVVAGQTYPVELWFTANENASDVVISAWIQSHTSDRVEINFADLISGSDYKAKFDLKTPEDMDPEEALTLYIRVESDAGTWEDSFNLRGQREAYNLDVLLVDMDPSAKAGSTVPIDVVIKNMGRHESKDTLVSVKIPELGISKTAYFDDLYPVDECDSDNGCDQTNSMERKIFLTLPETAEAGSYRVEITASNEDTQSTVVKTLEITAETAVRGQALANPSSETFAVGEEAVYQLVLVNSGSNVAIYTIAPEASDALSVTLSDSVAVVPAGSSKTVNVYVKANREGTFGFAVTATSDNLSQKVNYTATVSGKSVVNSNNIIALTIVLAIIFVVLVIVLIVLLTRKPQKSEEFGESYY